MNIARGSLAVTMKAAAVNAINTPTDTKNTLEASVAASTSGKATTLLVRKDLTIAQRISGKKTNSVASRSHWPLMTTKPQKE